jgi:hypothetical protein
MLLQRKAQDVFTGTMKEGTAGSSVKKEGNFIGTTGGGINFKKDTDPGIEEAFSKCRSLSG